MPLPELYQTTNPWVGLADFLARLVAPDPTADAEGLYWGGGTPTATYPAFLALVADDNGRLWPCGSTDAVAIEFVDTIGTCGLYLVPFDDQELPSSEPGQIGSFSLLAATVAPPHALELGEGSVTDSAFTSFTEAAGIRRDTLAVGSGQDADITLVARNGDANPPGLRYQASSNQWQYSNNGTTWTAIGSGGGSMTSFVAAADEGTAQTIADGDTLSLLGLGFLRTDALATDTLRVRPRLETLLGEPNVASPYGGELRLDAAGALWEYRGEGYGAWVQRSIGILHDAGDPANNLFTGSAPPSDYTYFNAEDGKLRWHHSGAWANVPLGTSGPRATVSRSATQSINHNSVTAIDWSGQTQALDGITVGSPTSRLVVPAGGAGRYLLEATATFNQNGTGERGIFLSVNGWPVRQQYLASLSSQYTALFAQRVVELEDGDWVELQVDQRSGGSLDMVAGDARTGLTMTRLGVW